MPFTVTKYPQGTFSWTDVSSQNISATKDFMTNLFGWTAQDMPTGQPGLDYTMFSIDGKYVAGGSAMQPGMEGVPSMWNNYVTVDDIDAMTAKAVELSAKVAMPVMDVLDSGRMSAIQDPTGAHVFLWQPKKHIGAGIVNVVGAMCWNELYSTDLPKAQDFYSKLFGWTFEAAPMNEGNTYMMIKNNGRSNGGAMQITAEMQGMHPCWIVYFTVANCAETIEKVKTLGGQVHMSRDVEQGKIAMIADPAGATFMVIELTVPADEWVE